jgi:protein-S-isoprenylcysteine O-methyltransferase Ste14
MKIALQTPASGLFGVAFFAVLLFWPAGTLSYWQAAAITVETDQKVVSTARIEDEEKMLREELAGYDEYTHRVHYRLVPGVW